MVQVKASTVGPGFESATGRGAAILSLALHALTFEQVSHASFLYQKKAPEQFYILGAESTVAGGDHSTGRCGCEAVMGAGEPTERPKIKAWNDPTLPVQWKFLTTLIWAPAFPIIRHSLKAFPSARTYVLGGAILVANLHGFWLINNPDLENV